MATAALCFRPVRPSVRACRWIHSPIGLPSNSPVYDQLLKRLRLLMSFPGSSSN